MSEQPVKSDIVSNTELGNLNQRVDATLIHINRRSKDLGSSFNRPESVVEKEVKMQTLFIKSLKDIMNDEKSASQVRKNAELLALQIVGYDESEQNVASQSIPQKDTFIGTNIVVASENQFVGPFSNLKRIDYNPHQKAGTTEGGNYFYANLTIPHVENEGDMKKMLTDLLQQEEFQTDISRLSGQKDSSPNYSGYDRLAAERQQKLDAVVNTLPTVDDQANAMAENVLKNRQVVLEYLRTGNLPDGMLETEMKSLLKNYMEFLLGMLKNRH